MVAESERTRKRDSGTIGKGKRLISLAFKFVGTAMRELCMGLLGKGIKYKGRRRDDALSRLIDSLPSNMDNKKKEMDGEKSFNAKGPSPKFILSNLYRKEARLYVKQMYFSFSFLLRDGHRNWWWRCGASSIDSGWRFI